MDVKVIVEGSEEHVSLSKSESTFFVEQANSKALVDQKSFCLLTGNSVKALVPASDATCTSQTPKTSFDQLVCCYATCIGTTAAAGAKTVAVKPLGVGIPTFQKMEDGTMIQTGLRGNLFWTHPKTSLAAKLATESSSSLNLMVVFVVPGNAFDDWDHAMDF